MPNYKIFQELPSNLRTRLYGMDGSDDIALVVNSAGVLAIQDNGGSLTVDATDFDIRGISNATDSILIYGNDGTSNVVILTDASGALAIQDNNGSITVDATNLDIRDLDEAADSVQIYGYDGAQNRAIKTDANGRLEVSTLGAFAEATEDVTTGNAFIGSTARDVSQYPHYTWFVKNGGLTNSADLQLQISPNNSDWVVDGTVETLGPQSLLAMVPNIFLRYTRLSYKSTVSDAATALSLTWQAYS